MTIRVLIADDEPLARERLRFLLASDAEVEIVGECRNGAEVISSLLSPEARRLVDVLFLDVQMPGRDGFELIEALQKARAGVPEMPITVFVTAHDQYAIRAFDVHALDYLTKPVEPKRLHATLARIKDRVASIHALHNHERLLEVLDDLRPGQANSGANALSDAAPCFKQSWNTDRSDDCRRASSTPINESPREYPKRLLVPNGPKDAVINIREIEWIEAADYYSCLHVGARSLMLRETVKQLASSLHPSQFVRIHRSIIVNMDYVREIAREGRGEGTVILTGGQRLRMSKTGWQNLMAVHRSLS